MNASTALPGATGDFTVDAEQQAAFSAMIGKIQQRIFE